MVVKETSHDLPTGVGIHCWPVLAAPPGQVHGGEVFASDGPVQEVGELVGRGPTLDCPGVDVSLADLAQFHVALGEPGQEGYGGEQVGLGVAGGGARPGFGGGSGPGLAQHPPGGIGAQQATLGGVAGPTELVGNPGFERDEGFVAGGQNVVGDQ